MKFDYCKEASLPGTIPSSFPYTYHFQFSLSYDEIQKILHKYGILMEDTIGNSYIGTLVRQKQVSVVLKILQEANNNTETIDLGIDYKQKYDELVKLLEPYKIDEDMSPATTLKMILKYHK